MTMYRTGDNSVVNPRKREANPVRTSLTAAHDADALAKTADARADAADQRAEAAEKEAAAAKIENAATAALLADTRKRIMPTRLHVAIPAQSAGTYQTSAIELGTFDAKPVISCDLEAATGTFDQVRYQLSNTGRNWFLVATITARRSALTLTINTLANINLLATSMPACVLHVTASHPSA